MEPWESISEDEDEDKDWENRTTDLEHKRTNDRLIGRAPSHSR